MVEADDPGSALSFPVPEAHVKTLILAAAALLTVSCVAPVEGPRPRAQAVQEELDRLSGTWVLVGGYLDGKPLAADAVSQSRITWTGDTISTYSPHIWKDTTLATIHVNPLTKPGQMDIVYKADPRVPALAIYEWLGPDRYRIAIDRRGVSRPEEFVSQPGTGQTLHVWQRLK